MPKEKTISYIEGENLEIENNFPEIPEETKKITLIYGEALQATMQITQEDANLITISPVQKKITSNKQDIEIPHTSRDVEDVDKRHDDFQVICDDDDLDNSKMDDEEYENSKMKEDWENISKILDYGNEVLEEGSAQDDEFLPLGSYQSEDRGFQSEFIYNKGNCRVFASIYNNVQSNKRFVNGFEFKKMPDDLKFIPHHLEDETEQFKYFYEELVASEVLAHYIQELDEYMNVNKNFPGMGCRLKTSNMTLTDRNYNNYKPPDKHENDYVSPKINFDANDENVTSNFNKKRNPTNKNVYIANETITEGEVLIQETPLVMCRSASCMCSGNHYLACYYCGESGNSFLCCPDCSIAIYCSESCRSDAKREYHFFECVATRNHLFGKADPCWLGFRMLLLGASVNYSTTVPSKYATLCEASIYYKSVDLVNVLRKAVIGIIYLIKFTNFFGYLHVRGYSTGSVYESYLDIGGLLVRHMNQAHSASLNFPDEYFSFCIDSNGARFGTPALCRKAFYCTHACKPNAALVFLNNFYYIKAVTKIEKGEKITINFVHLDESFYGDSKQYACKCIACTIYSKDYNGRLYMCLSCGDNTGVMQHFPPMWKCLKCAVFESFPMMDETKHHIDSLYNKLKDLQFDKYTTSVRRDMMCYLDKYRTLYAKYYPEYIFILQKLVYYGIRAMQLELIDSHGYLLLEKLSKLLHKHSFAKLAAMVNVINVCMKTAYDKSYDRKLRDVVRFGKLIMHRIEPLCKFYCMEQQLAELRKTFANSEEKYVVATQKRAQTGIRRDLDVGNDKTEEDDKD